MSTLSSWGFSLPNGRTWTVGPVPAVVGVLNRTPDSFSDGGVHLELSDAVESGLQMLKLGAAGLDVGGESTRPGSDPVSPEEQIRRVCPLLRALRARTEAPISVDTMDPSVAAEAIAAGADIINDVNGFRADGWENVFRRHPVPLILVHMQGSPRTMQDAPDYPDGVVAAVEGFFRERLAALAALGVDQERVLLDPGIGFGKRLEDNLDLLRNLGHFRQLGRPLYVGLSRKRFLGAILDKNVGDRDVGTVAANAVAIAAGASVLRVHNVDYTMDLVRTVAAIRDGSRARGA